MTYDYKNKVAIITGGSSGFGKALAHRLVKLGASVVLGDIDQKTGEQVVVELESIRGNSVAFTTCDVTKRSDQKKLVQLALKKFGHFDIMVNNAGVADYENFYEDDDKDNWEKVMRIDLDGVMIGTRIAYDYFAREGRSGIILNTASLAGIYPQPGQPVYGVAKAGVVQLSRSVAGMGAGSNIYCIPICPSFSPTGLLAKGVEVMGEAFEDATADRVPVEQVIDAFILAIENAKKCNGIPVRITPQRGIDLFNIRGKAANL